MLTSPVRPPRCTAGRAGRLDRRGRARPGFPEGAETNLPLGTSVDDAGVTDTSRVYAAFDLSRYEGKKVTAGTVYVEERTDADCTRRSIEIWRTRPVAATPTWKKAPAEITRLDEIRTPSTARGRTSAST